MEALEKQESAERPSGQGDHPAGAKKVWHKPTYCFERVFETMALSCGKLATQGQCGVNRKQS
jgi:hypothetical protein